jgi:uroporphyrinogen III methyltransferase/synthase
MSCSRGKVYLIGAGPGAPDLLTLRAFRALREADVIISDDLLPEDFLADSGIPLAGKEIIRLPKHHDAEQSAINELLVRLSRQGRVVARLKNGDPFIFGRGSEEAGFLAECGVPFEVIPGLSAGVAGPVGADLPLTRRGDGRSVAFATAVEAGGGGVAEFPRADSLVIFMAVGRLEGVAARLQEQGWPSDTPCILIERAGMPWEREAGGPLAGIAACARDVGIASPALLVVGRAAAVRVGGKDRPTVLFTGLDPANYRALGRILHWPALVIEPEADGIARAPGLIAELRAGRFQDVIFTSRIGVGAFFSVLAEAGGDARALAGCRVIAAGGGTAQRLRDFGLRADAAGEPGGSAGILAAMKDPQGRRALLVQGTHAPRGLEERLRAGGAEVARLALHRVAPNPALGRPLPEHDAILFMSPSGAKAYSDVYGPAAFRREVWCIGHVTASALAELDCPAALTLEAPDGSPH